jgi:hypothetical protein
MTTDYVALAQAAFANTNIAVTVTVTDPGVVSIRIDSELNGRQRRLIPTLLGAAGFYVIGNRRRRGFVPERWMARHRSTLT